MGKTIPGVWLPADQARPTAAVHVRPGAPGRVNCPLARSWLYPCPNVHLVPGKWPDPKGHLTRLTIQASSDGQLVPLDQRSSGPAGCRHCTPMPRQPAQGRQPAPGLHHPLAGPWPHATMAPRPHGPMAPRPPHEHHVRSAAAPRLSPRSDRPCGPIPTEHDNWYSKGLMGSPSRRLRPHHPGSC